MAVTDQLTASMQRGLSNAVSCARGIVSPETCNSFRADPSRALTTGVTVVELRRVYRRRLSASVMAPAATRTMTMTVASASAEARVSYQLFQSSSMLWPLSSARHQR
jgi:hypothetical protein